MKNISKYCKHFFQILSAAHCFNDEDIFDLKTYYNEEIQSKDSGNHLKYGFVDFVTKNTFKNYICVNGTVDCVERAVLSKNMETKNVKDTGKLSDAT